MPRVKLTKTTRFALYVLVVYLAFLVTLLGVKFIRVLKANQETPTSASAVTP